MAIVKMRRILECAEKNEFAVGYFESFNLESMQAVVDAAEELQSPVIIGFSGMFTNSPRRDREENISDYGALAVSVARNARVPAAIILNEADDMSMVVASLSAGFNAVMYEKPGEPYEETLEMTRYLVRTAHYVGADVESEFGEMPEADVSKGTVSQGMMTDPDRARSFVKQTGVDALAVAVGNVHLLEGKKCALDFDLLKALRKRIDVPLVLHGGTGISEEDTRKAISLGVSKINIGTAMKRAFLDVMKARCCGRDISRVNPHELIGWGGPEDVLFSGRKAVAEVVAGYMRIFGGENRAKLV